MSFFACITRCQFAFIIHVQIMDLEVSVLQKEEDISELKSTNKHLEVVIRNLRESNLASRISQSERVVEARCRCTVDRQQQQVSMLILHYVYAVLRLLYLKQCVLSLLMFFHSHSTSV